MIESSSSAAGLYSFALPAQGGGLFDNLTTGSEVHGVWVFFGLAAQGAVLVCLLIHWILCRRRGSVAVPRALIGILMGTTVVLLVYAALRHDIVFVVGQLLGILIALRALELTRRREPQEIVPPEEGFPRVEPDSAEIDLRSNELKARK